MKSIWKVCGCLLLILPLVSACQAAGAAARNQPPSVADTPTPPPPPTQETTMNAHWTYQTSGAIWGNPALGDGLVFIGSDDGNLYALDARSGALKWKFASRGIVRSQPALADGMVYFTSDDGSLYALNAEDGAQAWSVDIGNFMACAERESLGNSPSPTGYDYVQSSPVVDGGTLYVGSRDGKVYALDAKSGSVEWTFATQDKIRATPAVDQGTVYIGSWDKLLYALDARTGQVRWVSPIGGEIQSTALIANGLVYCASRKASVVALDAATGELKWEHSYGTNMWVESSPRLVGGVVYIGSSGSKFVLGLDALTGKPTAFYVSRDFHWSTPLVIGNNLYIGGTSYNPDKTGGLLALRIVDGKLPTPGEDIQLFPVVDTLEASGAWNGVASSPAGADGLIYFGGLVGILYAVNTIP